MTIRELWEAYRRDNVIEGMETPAEVALQQAGFVCGVIATLGTLYEGGTVDIGGWRSLLDEALAGIDLECDKRGCEPEPSVN